MRARILAGLVLLMAVQSIGCCRLCRCCRRGDDRIPPPKFEDRIPLPPPASSASKGLPPATLPTGAASGKQTGAYGGSGESGQ